VDAATTCRIGDGAPLLGPCAAELVGGRSPTHRARNALACLIVTYVSCRRHDKWWCDDGLKVDRVVPSPRQADSAVVPW